MREILFRGKQPVSGEWVYGSLITETNPFDKDMVMTHIYDDSCNEILVIPETVGQYTGLKDKNGNKIFEGDIIRHYYKNLAKNGYTSDEGVVKWDCKECFFYRTSLSGEDKTISVDCIYKVIGNIFDNPELLTRKTQN